MKANIMIIGMLISVLFIFGCSKSDNIGPGGTAMTIQQAMQIAQNSVCVSEGGPLTNKFSYNNNSRTWWIDLDIQKEGCFPACVVSEDNRTAEINWRCTGAIPP